MQLGIQASARVRIIHRGAGPGYIVNMHRAYAAIFALALVVAGCASSPSPPSPKVPATFHVDVGFEDTATGAGGGGFFPQSLVVNVGDTVVFTMRSHEAHTISFNAPKPLPEPLLPQPDHAVAANPVVFLPLRVHGALTARFDGTGFVTSGVLQKPGDSFTVSFEAAGTFQAQCLLHASAMKATIIVNTAGTPSSTGRLGLPRRGGGAGGGSPGKGGRPPGGRGCTRASEQRRRQPLLDGVRRRGKRGGRHRFHEIHRRRKAVNQGGRLRHLRHEEKHNRHAAHDHVPGGDRTSRAPDFTAAGGGPSAAHRQPESAPPGARSPRALRRHGILQLRPRLAGLPTTPQEFTVTFTKPGTFSYLCAFHADDGMKGTIIVQQ